MEARHRAADGGEHPLHLVLPSFVEDELGAPRGEAPRLRRRREAVLELDTVAQPLQRVLGRIALDVGDIGLLDAVARMGEPMGKLPVVREQKRSGVSASSRPTGTTRGSPGTSSTTVRRPARVARGREDAGGLVEQDVSEPLPRNLLARRPRPGLARRPRC